MTLARKFIGHRSPYCNWKTLLLLKMSRSWYCGPPRRESADNQNLRTHWLAKSGPLWKVWECLDASPPSGGAITISVLYIQHALSARNQRTKCKSGYCPSLVRSTSHETLWLETGQNGILDKPDNTIHNRSASRLKRGIRLMSRKDREPSDTKGQAGLHSTVPVM